MQCRTEWGSGMTRNAVCLAQKKVKPQLFSVRRGSCGPEATTCGLGYCTRRPLVFSLCMDVTSSRSLKSIDKSGSIFLSADILSVSLSPRSNSLLFFCLVLAQPLKQQCICKYGFLLSQKSPSFLWIFHILDLKSESFGKMWWTLNFEL